MRALAALLLLACGAPGGPDAGHDAGGSDAGATDGGLSDAGAPDAGAPDAGPPGLEWPNAESSAASDPWIAAHHDELTRMRPRILALNFVNGRSNADMEAHFEAIFGAMREATRPHGEGAPFLDPVIARAVDLTDAAPPPDHPYRNSTRYPREVPPEGRWSFDYERLFHADFAEAYGFEDPAAPGAYLDLCALSERGLVHEVWIYGDADVPDVSAAEILAITPSYDEAGNRLEGFALDRCSANGCFDFDDVIPEGCTRTLRVGWVNHTRGVGCYLESLGHGIEGLALRGTRPAWEPHFRELAGFDLDDRYGLRAESWYACGYLGDCLRYPTTSSVEYTDVTGESGTIDPYVPNCGNAHWPPNARRHYDIGNPVPVLSACATWRQPGGAPALVSSADWSAYEAIAGDCTGAFAVWWWQRFPSVDRRARDDAGAPMRNFWPYLYY